MLSTGREIWIKLHLSRKQLPESTEARRASGSSGEEAGKGDFENWMEFQAGQMRRRGKCVLGRENTGLM